MLLNNACPSPGEDCTAIICVSVCVNGITIHFETHILLVMSSTGQRELMK